MKLTSCTREIERGTVGWKVEGAFQRLIYKLMYLASSCALAV